jgi:hypothetical protein
MTTLWIYVDTSKEVGDVDHLKVFADEVAANRWFEENDPEGVAFEYDVIETDRVRRHHAIAIQRAGHPLYRRHSRMPIGPPPWQFGRPGAPSRFARASGCLGQC